MNSYNEFTDKYPSNFNICINIDSKFYTECLFNSCILTTQKFTNTIELRQGWGIEFPGVSLL